MSKTALVRVVGFNDIERHALNSLFRVSQQHSPSYALWTEDETAEPCIMLLDAQHPTAESYAELGHRDPQLKVLWVGEQPHIFAWRSYQRPIVWSQVLQGMDAAYAVTHAPLDSDYPDYPDSAPAMLDSTGRGLLTRKRVLIVDDDLTARLYLKAKLSLLEPVVDVDEAATGDEAMQMVRTFIYDGVLLDINMPGTDGYAVCRAIKRPSSKSPSSSSGRIPKVVIITSRDGMVDRVRGSLAGADAYLPKPPHPARLRDLITSL